MESKVVEEAKKQGYYFLSSEEAGKLAKILFRPNGALNPEVVGKPAARLAELAGFSVPVSAKILVAREREAGIGYP